MQLDLSWILLVVGTKLGSRVHLETAISSASTAGILVTTVTIAARRGFVTCMEQRGIAQRTVQSGRSP